MATAICWPLSRRSGSLLPVAGQGDLSWAVYPAVSYIFDVSRLRSVYWCHDLHSDPGLLNDRQPRGVPCSLGTWEQRLLASDDSAHLTAFPLLSCLWQG
jgi:hypothetical protein